MFVLVCLIGMDLLHTPVKGFNSSNFFEISVIGIQIHRLGGSINMQLWKNSKSFEKKSLIYMANTVYYY